MVFKKGEKHEHPREKDLLLAKMDDDIRLFASSTCLKLSKLRAGKWTGEWFYTTLDGAIRGYIKHQLRNKKRMANSGTLEKLIKSVEKLNKSVDSLIVNLKENLKDVLLPFDKNVESDSTEENDDRESEEDSDESDESDESEEYTL